MGPEEDGVRHGESREPSRASDYELARLALLKQQSPLEMLRIITEGDPLGIYRISEARTRARHLFLDPLRVFDESVHHVVLLSPILTREEDMETWLVGRVDEAIDNLLRRDWESLIDETISAELVQESADYLKGCFGFEAPAAFRASIRFNHLAGRSRRIYFALFLEGRSVAACLEAGLGPEDSLKEHARLAAETILSEVKEFRLHSGSGGRVGGEHG